MEDYEPHIPHVDDTVSPAELHRRCEQVAVPDFDWLNEPIIAIVDGLAEAAHHAVPHRHRKQEP